MRKNTHVRICGGLGSATTLVYPTVRSRHEEAVSHSPSPSPIGIPDATAPAVGHILIDTQAELQELVVASGLKVLEAMLEEDRAAVCGPRYAHQPARQAYRTGHTPSQVVLGGRKVAIRRPRARRAGEEVLLPTARAFANADPLNRRVVDQMLIGVATRQYARSLEPLGADVTTRGTSKRAVSRRFVAQTQAQLEALTWRYGFGCEDECGGLCDHRAPQMLSVSAVTNIVATNARYRPSLAHHRRKYRRRYKPRRRYSSTVSSQTSMSVSSKGRQFFPIS